MLTDGLGRVYGRMGIVAIYEGRTAFMDNGAARKIDFSITLHEYGEDDPGAEATPLNRITKLATQPAASQVGDPFTDLGSASELTNWTNAPDFGLFTGAATAAGFTPGQLGAVAQATGDPSTVEGALGPMGLAPFTPDQTGAWASLGVDTGGLTTAFNTARAPAATSIGLESLRNAGPAAIDTIGGVNAGALGTLQQRATTLSVVLNVDPRITQTVESLVRLF